MKPLLAWGILLIGLGTGCTTPPPRLTAYAYPAGGYEGGHTSRDVAHCEGWAKQQTGYDPVAETVTGAAVGGSARGAYTYSQSKDGYDKAYVGCMAARPAAPAPVWHGTATTTGARTLGGSPGWSPR